MRLGATLTMNSIVLSTVIFVTLITSTSATATSTSTSTDQPAPTPSISPTLTNQTLFPSAILNSTNTYRAQHNATALTWNTTLAAFALTVAQTCIFAHSGGPYGENLVAGYTSVAGAVDAWGDEQAQYDYGAPGFSEATGHFTQLVWRDTTGVGCAAVDCEGAFKGLGSPAPGWFVVCEYWPRGNVLGEFADQVAPPVARGESVSVRSINGGEIAGVLVVGVIMVGLFLVGD